MDLRLGACLALIALHGVGAAMVREDHANNHAHRTYSVAVDAEVVATQVEDLPAADLVETHVKDKAGASCEVEGELEDALDALSWEVLALPKGARGSPVVRAQVGWHEHQHRNVQDADSAATVGLASWMQAVDRTQDLAKNVISDLPPACPSHVPASDPYWAEIGPYVSAHGKHNVCRYSNDCTKNFTNLERLNSIRKTTLIARQFLDKFDVQNGLYGGTAIGAYRCQDILPWDKDSDVFMLHADVPKILKLFDGIENDGTGFLGRYIDMVAFGREFDGFALHEKHAGCMPFVVVDKSTGFFTDVFPMRAVGSKAVSPYWGHLKECDSQKLFNGCKSKHCRKWSLENTLPPSKSPKCWLGDNAFACPAKLLPFLEEQFGSEVGTHADSRVAVRK